MIARVLVRFVAAVGLGVFGLLASAGDAQAVCGDGAIDGIEACDLGTANGQPGFCCSTLCEFSSAATSCRADAGECDVAELCDGAGACPIDGFEMAGAACGSATDTSCDNPDTCSVSGTCVSNFELATFACRPSAGDCDVAELCDGAGGACPTDTTVAEGVSCRTSAGLCDIEEFCPGGDPECPSDVFRPDIYSCRPPVGSCDLAEHCSGSTAACPTDVIADAGVQCRESEADCDQAEICDGVDGVCPANFSITIDFDESTAPAFFSQATPLTTQYEALGVVWQGTGARVSEFALNGLTDYSPPNFVAYSENQSMGTGGASDNIDTMDLTCPAESVSFLVGSESQGTFGASAFDGNGIPLDQAVVAMDTAMQVVTLAADPGAHIAHVDYAGAGVTEGDAKPRFAIDDLVLFIPEPAQALIGLTSLAMLAALRRRARRQ